MIFDEYYELMDFFDDDIEKVAKAIQKLSTKKYIITNIRNDLLDYTELNHKKYLPAIKKALDMKQKDLKALVEVKPKVYKMKFDKIEVRNTGYYQYRLIF